MTESIEASELRGRARTSQIHECAHEVGVSLDEHLEMGAYLQERLDFRQFKQMAL